MLNVRRPAKGFFQNMRVHVYQSIGGGGGVTRIREKGLNHHEDEKKIIELVQ